MRLSYSDADGNGIINNTEDFRDDFNTHKGWTDTNTPPVFSYEPVDGNYAGKIVNNTTTEKYLHSDYVMEINNSAATSYTYSVRVRGTVGAKADLYLFMKTATETGYFTQVDFRTHTVSNGTIWTTLTGMVNVPATIKKLNIRLDNNGGGTLWFDDVTLKRTTAAASEIVEEDNYYPFGMKHSGYNNVPRTDRNIDAQRFKYNNKELQDELGLNWYDYGWRNYNPELGRWISIDPLLNDLDFAFDDSDVDEDNQAEVLAATATKIETADGVYNPSNLNPYGYDYNNPVVYDDPDGKCPTCPTAVIGGLLGGGIELGSQLLSGKSLSEVDWADVGVEMLKGAAIGSGAGLIAGGALETTSTAIKASLDYSTKDGLKTVFNGSKSMKSAGYDAAADVIGGKIGARVAKTVGRSTQKAVTKAMKAETKATKNLVKQTNKYNKVTNGGRNTSGSRATAAKTNLNKATTASQVARNNTVRAQMTNSATKGVTGQVTNGAAQGAAGDKVKESLDIK